MLPTVFVSYAKPETLRRLVSILTVGLRKSRGACEFIPERSLAASCPQPTLIASYLPSSELEVLASFSYSAASLAVM